MDHRGLAEVVSSCATGLAVIAVLGALFIAVVGFPQGRGPPVRRLSRRAWGHPFPVWSRPAIPCGRLAVTAARIALPRAISSATDLAASQSLQQSAALHPWSAS